MQVRRNSYKLGRLPLPDGVRRLVRQRCGFGCVLCGAPVYEIHHLDGYSSARTNGRQDLTPAERLTLLCGNHHTEHTAGRLPDSIVEEANKFPFHLETGNVSRHHLYFGAGPVTIRFGGITYDFSTMGVPPPQFPLTMDGVPMIRLVLSGGIVLVSLLLFDSKNRLKLWIEDNELMYRADLWDVEFVGRRLTIRDGPRNIAMQMLFDVPNSLNIEKAVFHCNGMDVVITGDKVHIPFNGSIISNVELCTSNVGLSIGDRDMHCAGVGILVRDSLRPAFSGTRIIKAIPNLPRPQSPSGPNCAVIIEGGALNNAAFYGHNIIAHRTHGYFNPSWQIKERTLGKYGEIV